MYNHRFSVRIGVLFFVFLGIVTACAAPSAPVAPTVPAAAPSDSPQPAPAIEAAPATSQDPMPDSSELSMSPPRLCDPENPQYSPLQLDRFWDGVIHPTTDEEWSPIAYANIEYSNELGQRFDILIFGKNDEDGTNTIQTYVDEGQVCLEALGNDPGTAIQYTSVAENTQSVIEPEELVLLQEIEAIASIAPADWSVFLAEYPFSLFIRFGLAIPEILSTADGLESLLVQATSGTLDTINPTDLDNLKIYAASLLPQYAEEIPLMDSSEFVFWFVDVFMNTDVAIHFSMDPTIYSIIQKGVHDYKAWCNTKGARLIVESVGNDPIAKFWQIGGGSYPPTKVPQGTSVNWVLSSSQPASFDAQVTGGLRDAKYKISEGWVQGAGCR